MAVQPVRHIAPFINLIFTVTSEWWVERWGEIHRGLDIATGGNDPVYSMLNGKVLEVGNTTTAGNYIIIYDDNPNSSTYGYATRYLHLQFRPLLPVGTQIQVGQEVGREGATGEGVTGIHLHVEMQDISRFNWQWHFSYTKSDYLDPTVFMGIDNEQGTQWIYNGTPIPTETKKKGFPWYLVADKLRNQRFIKSKNRSIFDKNKI